MNSVSQKTEIGPLDGTPEKRMFWSIISDYDLKTGLFELIDNALDSWIIGGRKKALSVDISLDANRQLISITDNSGGVRQDRLRMLIAPGGSINDPLAEVIGIFGVGGKRAGVALGEEVRIKTRFLKENTFEIDITGDWLANPEWQLNYYQIPDIAPGTTRVEISHLRKSFSLSDVDRIRRSIGETYEWFLGEGCVIHLNGKAVLATSFANWAYPPSGVPRDVRFDVNVADGQSVRVNILAGLVRDRNPEEENYGVYFYCNHRLIAKEVKVREVGYFVTSEAGVPHPDASLSRVLVYLEGGARWMPWNSSKTAINFDHAVFQQIRPALIQLTSYFSSLSRRTKDDWETKVFRYQSGAMEETELVNVSVKNPLVLPPLPRVNKQQVEKLRTRNKAQIKRQPWTLGLIEAMAAVEVISRQRLETKNRIALILLDSNFEIALKEFIVHREDLFPPSQFGKAAISKLFENRANVISAVTAKVSIPPTILGAAQHYYNIRNKLVHERATVEPTDSDIENYRLVIESVLHTLFTLRF